MELFRKFIAPKKILIADPSPTSRSGVFKVLADLGVKPFQMILVNNLKDAKIAIASQKPDIVLTEYNLGKDCGLELLRSQRNVTQESRSQIFILLTGNTSQSAVAQAAEEDLDAY